MPTRLIGDKEFFVVRIIPVVFYGQHKQLHAANALWAPCATRSLSVLHPAKLSLSHWHDDEFMYTIFIRLRDGHSKSTNYWRIALHSNPAI